jgi:hypothetical protein
MENLKALKHGIHDMSKKTRYDLVGSFIHGVSEELDIDRDVKFIHLQDIIQWIYDDTLSSKQILSKYALEMKKAIKHTDPFFEEGVHWCLYKPKKEKRNHMYLTVEGFTYWSIGSRTPKSNLVRYWVSRGYTRRTEVTYASPVKKRRISNLKDTPIRKRLKTQTSTRVFHPDLKRALSDLRNLELGNRVVYFIWDGGQMKIGLTTKGARKRVKQLQTGNSKDLEVFREIQSDKIADLEKFLHSAFKEKHIRGEWFRVSKEEIEQLVDFIDG